MKNYRLREGSIAWYMKKYGRWIIALILIAVVMAFFIGANEPHSNSDSEEKPKVDKVFTEGKKVAVNTFEDFEPYDVPLDEDLQLYIYELSERYGIEMELILAVIAQESNYDSTKIGDNGNSVGLMQVQYHHHVDRIKEFNVTDLTNPYENVLVGVDYLAECLANYDKVASALTVYNAGATGAERYYFSKGVDGNEYANKVMERWEKLIENH